MWINFECKNGKKFVVRPFLGGVNGITGEATIGNMGSLLRRMNQLTRVQDYIVLPEQRWLDGIATSPGVVRQFVAAETAPPRREQKALPIRDDGLPESEQYRDSTGNRRGDPEENRPGASVEWQVTGQDAVGGIQLQIIPSFDVENMSASSMRDVCAWGSGLMSYAPIPGGAKAFDVLCTPSEQNLQDGDFIHVQDAKSRRESRDKTVADLVAVAPMPFAAQDVLDLEFPHVPDQMCTFNVRRLRSSKTEVSVKVSGVYLACLAAANLACRLRLATTSMPCPPSSGTG